MGAVLERLRAEMRARGVDYYWVPSSDEYLNEYVLERSRRLLRLTGFRGSAGQAVVGLEGAWLCVDGRYHIQAEDEVDGCWRIEKLGEPGARSALDVLLAESRAQAQLTQVGYDAFTMPADIAASAEGPLQRAGARLTPVAEELVDIASPPPASAAPQALERLDLRVTGATTERRLARVRGALAELGCDGTVVTKLDAIAWLVGRRGQDIPFNPVFEAALVITTAGAWLFVGASRMASFAGEPLTVEPLEAFRARLAELARAALGQRWLVDASRTTAGVLRQLREAAGAELQDGCDVIELVKSRKSPEESAAMRRAGVSAGAAKVRALRALEASWDKGEGMTEAGFAAALEASYAAEPEYRGLSFATISAFGAHSAIVHYSDPSPEVAAAPGDWVLIDSGAHYLGGTTDATRTLIRGAPSEEQRRIYTLVLRAHIAGARQVFPAGTAGVQLDAIIRAPLWQAREDYIHGTGHGVGAGLNVHEGPMLIGLPGRGPASLRPLEEGQVVSIEPGCYHRGVGGVRLENLYEVVSRGEDRLGRPLLGFETRTWLPFDRRLIALEVLTEAERSWLAAYQAEVAEVLTGGPEPRLRGEDAAWLERQCEMS